MGSASSKTTSKSWTKIATNYTSAQWSSCNNSQDNNMKFGITASGSIIFNNSKIKQSQMNKVDFTCKSEQTNDNDLKSQIAEKIAQDAKANVSGITSSKSKSQVYNEVHTDIMTNLDISQVRTDAQSQRNNMETQINSGKMVVANKSVFLQDQANNAVAVAMDKQFQKMKITNDIAKSIDQKNTAVVAGIGGSTSMTSSAIMCCCILIIAMVAMNSRSNS